MMPKTLMNWMLVSLLTMILQAREFGDLFSLNNFTQNTVGYRVGKAQAYNILNKSRKSTLYQVVAPQLNDSFPMKLIDLHGSHYDIGYDYGFLLAGEIQFSYKTLFQDQFKNNRLLLKVFEGFFDWQYSSYIRKQLPLSFLDQIRGVTDGAYAAKKLKNIKKIIQRTLVISSIPSSVNDDLPAVLWDEILKGIFLLKNQKVQNFVESNIIYVITKVRQTLKKLAIHCSFFGVWGKRTFVGELYTSRNLDWNSDTGINKNKLITVFNIDNSIPHATLGFPGVLGALTGISAKHITTHQAGQASDLQTMEGFQWTLRMRHVLMNANNLNQAIKLWNSTKSTLGMNFMLGSGDDKKAVVFEQMRGYKAMFEDNDPRQSRTIFIEQNGSIYVAGYSMPQAVFRTNHGYDSIIRRNSHTKFRPKESSTIQRYLIQRDLLNQYQKNNIKITSVQALNMTAIMGAKQHRNYYSCAQGPRGSNVISVTYYPSQLKMWAAFQYGEKQTFRSACCGVYIEIDLNQWFKIKKQ